MGTAIPTPGTRSARLCTTAATTAVPMSIRTYIRVRAIRYNEARIGISTPPTFSATTVRLDMRAGPAGARREERDVHHAADERQEHHREGIASMDSDLAVRIGQDTHLDQEDQQHEEEQERQRDGQGVDHERAMVGRRDRGGDAGLHSASTLTGPVERLDLHAVARGFADGRPEKHAGLHGYLSWHPDARAADNGRLRRRRAGSAGEPAAPPDSRGCKCSLRRPGPCGPGPPRTRP